MSAIFHRVVPKSGQIALLYVKFQTDKMNYLDCVMNRFFRHYNGRKLNNENALDYTATEGTALCK